MWEVITVAYALQKWFCSWILSLFYHLRKETLNTFASNREYHAKITILIFQELTSLSGAKGFRCIFGNQGFWYLEHLDVLVFVCLL